VPNYAEYFERISYKSTWHIGDRVIGKYNKIPFIGTVGNDALISLIEGPRVTVHLDLPIKVDDVYKSFIIVKPKELRRLTEFDDTSTAKAPTGKKVKNEKPSEERNEKRKTK